MIRDLLFAAFAAVLPILTAAADSYSPPPDYPFQPLIGDIDNNLAPVTTPVETLNIKGDKGEISKTITGGASLTE